MTERDELVARLHSIPVDNLIRLVGEALVHSYDGCEDDEIGLEGLEALEAYQRWKRAQP